MEAPADFPSGGFVHSITPALRLDQPPYLKESDTRLRNAATFPFSTLISIFVTSATRRSRNEPPAVSTALRPASSHDFSLKPTTSPTLYTVSACCSAIDAFGGLICVRCCFAMKTSRTGLHPLPI